MSNQWPPVGSGSGVTSLNSETGDITLTEGSGITITPSGSNIEISASGSSGANTALSNLASTNINVDLLSTNAINIGSDSNPFGQIHGTQFRGEFPAIVSTSSGTVGMYYGITINNTSNVATGNITGTSTDLDIDAIILGGNLNLTTITSATANTGVINITTGSATAGNIAGDINLKTGSANESSSGNINLTTGDSATGSTGSISIIPGTNTAQVGGGAGSVTIAGGNTGDPAGTGGLVAVSGGESPTNNLNGGLLLSDGTALSLISLFPIGSTGGIPGINITDGAGLTAILIQANVEPTTPNRALVWNDGTTIVMDWGGQSGDPLGLATSGIWIATPDGESAPIAFETGAGTENASGNISLATGEISGSAFTNSGSMFLTTGNSTLDGVGTGGISLQTGSATTGSTGNISLTPGSTSGTPGKITMGGITNLFNASADPAAASAGDIYFNTNTNVIRIYNGATWQSVTAV